MKIAYAKCRPKNMVFPIVAWLIMLFQKQFPWNKKASSHRALLVTMGGVDYVIDATGKDGFHMRLDVHFYEHYEVVEKLEFDIPELTQTIVKDWVLDNLLVKYDYSQILGIMFRIIGFASANNFGSDFRRLTCNEVILSLMSECLGYDVGDPDFYDLIKTDQFVSVSLGRYKTN